jgi:hypothetical protein
MAKKSEIFIPEAFLSESETADFICGNSSGGRVLILPVANVPEERSEELTKRCFPAQFGTIKRQS